jgi:hypothetical protein
MRGAVQLPPVILRQPALPGHHPTLSMQPERKALIAGTRSITFGLRATVCSTASTAPVSSGGGVGTGSKNMNLTVVT